jgi:hypothetical protein
MIAVTQTTVGIVGSELSGLKVDRNRRASAVVAGCSRDVTASSAIAKAKSVPTTASASREVRMAKAWSSASLTHSPETTSTKMPIAMTAAAAAVDRAFPDDGRGRIAPRNLDGTAVG